MKNYCFLLVLFLLSACGVKQTQNLMSAGNYDDAINNSINSLKNNKEKKGNQDYVYLLEEAFAKAKERDLNTLNLLEKDSNLAQLEKIYNLYIGLNNRQEKIKPILPLKILNKDRNAMFPFDNYNDKIITSKNNLSNYLYTNAKSLLLTKNKSNFRKAHDDLSFLNQINPNYKSALSLINEAFFKGTDYVNVYTKNETNMVIPLRLENDLLDFSTYGLNTKWTEFHNIKRKGIHYDYSMCITFREINISPERVKEREFIKERQIKDGQKRLLDASGKEVIDNLGKVVMVDNMIKTTVNINEFRQLKNCIVTAKINYIDATNNQLLQSFPLTSEFVFENVYSHFKGDRRAADDNYYPFFDRQVLPFPSNEQMIYDTGENLKMKIKDIMNQHKFRN